MSDDRRLQRPAAEYVAGDLDAAEAERVAAAAEHDPELRAELAFWERMHPQLGAHGRPPGRPPGPGLIAAIRQRAAAEATPASEPSGPGWWRTAAVAGWSAAAAAVLTAVLIAGNHGGSATDAAPQLTAYDENGARIIMPERVDTEQQLAFASRRVSPDELAATTVEERPWFGIWTQPIALQGFEQDHGLRILRVAAGSPADDAGLRPGDVLVSLADCPVMSRFCISRAYRQAEVRPGDPVSVVYYRASDGERIERQVRLARAWE